MSFAAQEILELLPAILRIRDQSQAMVTPALLAPNDRVALVDLEGKVAAHIALTPAEEAQLSRLRQSAMAGPLASLLAVAAEQIAVLQEDLDQLYDDQFIETCADWVVPYIGDLIGYRALHGVAPRISSPRAEVANTIGYRRRKGTAAMLEQLARDVTDWPARVVEFFQLLQTTQYMNHIRLHNAATPDLRRWEPLERLGSAFDSLAHTIEVRRVATRAGRYNIPNIGIFFWRIQPFRLSKSPAVAVDARRFLFSPLGSNTPLFTRPTDEDRITHIATPLNVPEPISRRVLHAYLDAYYGVDDLGNEIADRSFSIKAGANLVPRTQIRACNLSDVGGGNWAHQPKDFVAVDPVLGRIAFPDDPSAASPPSAPSNVIVTFHYGFAAEIAGGPYERADTFAKIETGQQLQRVRKDAMPATPGVHVTIQAALDVVQLTGGVVQIDDSGRYAEALHINATPKVSIELRAANEQRPTLVLGGDFKITGSPGASVTLNGLRISASDGAPASSPGIVRVANTSPAAPGQLQLRLRHCTLVPGLFLDVEGEPQLTNLPSLIVATENVAVEIDKSILGGVRLPLGSKLVAGDSILDSTSAQLVAYSDLDDVAAGGALTLRECTVIGKVHAEILELVSNSILHAEADAADANWPVPVRAVRKQEGCVRFSYLPMSSIVPRRYRCQPDLAIATEIERIEKAANAKLDATQRAAVRAGIEAWLEPGFMAVRYARSDYALLRESSPLEIRTGADDESEMGVFHGLYQPQRVTNVRVRLDEYLRFGLEAGIFFA